MSDKHLSSEFEAELQRLSARLIEMGELAQAMVAKAIEALTRVDGRAAARVLLLEQEINANEVELDHDLSTIIALRQPAAGDLRYLLGVSRANSTLERIGDDATRIARIVERLNNASITGRLAVPIRSLSAEATTVMGLLRQSLDAFAGLDAKLALQVLRHDEQIVGEFDGLMRKLVTYMMEDPRTISPSIELVSVAKAIESVAEHAKNLAEETIYIVKGAEVRHITSVVAESVVAQA